MWWPGGRCHAASGRMSLLSDRASRLFRVIIGMFEMAPCLDVGVELGSVAAFDEERAAFVVGGPRDVEAGTNLSDPLPPGAVGSRRTTVPAVGALLEDGAHQGPGRKVLIHIH